MNKKMLLLGLDGATLKVLRPLVERGVMPFLDSLMQKGTYAPLTSTIPYISPTAWCSFMTGKNPGKHGVFDFRSKVGGSYNFEKNIPNVPKRGTIWKYLSEAGKKNIVFNIPMTYPPQPINGIMVTGFGTPGLQSNFTYPEEVRKEILDGFDYVLDVYWARQDIEDELMLMDEITAMDGTQIDVAGSLMKKYDTDFVALGLISTDRIQHRFYKHINKYLNDPDYDSAIVRKILEHMSLIDEKVGAFYKKWSFTDIILMSDHGFTECNMALNVNRIFYDLGWLEFHKSVKKKDNALLNAMRNIGLSGHNIRKFARRIGLGRVGQVNKLLYSQESLHWEKTKVFCVTDFGIYLNVKGREPLGTIEEHDYERMRDEVIEKLLAFRHKDKQVFYKIYKREEIYHGEFLDIAPDLVIGDFDTSFTIGSAENRDMPLTRELTIRSGTHDIAGSFVASGENFVKHDLKGDPNIVDLMPTILAYYGVPIPEDVDGRVLTEIFKIKPKIAKTKGLDGNITGGDNYTEDEKDKVIDQLKNLGYL